MNRPAFKNSELGPIPVDWEVKRFDDVYSFAAAGDLQKGFYSPLKDSIHKYCIYSNGLSDKGLYGYTSHPRYKQNAITITGRGTLGHAEYRVEDFDAIIRLLILTPKGEVDNQFIVYWINYLRPFKHESTSIPQLTVPQVACTSLPFPPLPEQRRIAVALSDADAWIESLDKLIEKKKLVKQGAMQALLSGKTRLPGFSGEWEDEVVGDAFVFLRTNTLSRSCLGETGCISDVHYGDVLVRYGNILDFSAETPPFIGEGHESRSIGDFLQDGDLVVADTAEDETVGKAVEIQHLGNRQAVAGLHTVACRPKQPFAPGWLGHFINSPFFHDQLLPLISGTKVSSISKENLKTVFVRRPPLAEQAAIASVLSGMDAELASLSREKAKAEQIKQGMMQELLTGRVRLAEGE